MAEQKKQNFLQGTALLAAATVIVKLVGALYKVPLNAIIGEKGFGYFSTAYEIYNILLMISTAGLPVAMSRMISQASSLEHYGQVRQVYSTAKRIFLLLGIVGSLLMTVFCRPLARFWNQPDAWAAIGFLGPCVLLICIMSAFRGYFQGQSNMIPTAVSQVLEVVTKLIVGMAAALAFLKATADVSLAAGGAILGVTASCLVSAMYLYGCFRKSYQQLPETGDVKAKISSDEAAIGYISFASVSEGVKALKVGGVTVSTETIADNSYVIQRPFVHAYVKGTKDDLVLAYLDFLKTDKAQELIESEHLVPVEFWK